MIKAEGTRLLRSLYITGFIFFLVLLSLWHKEASLGALSVLDRHLCSSPPPNAEVDPSFSSLPLLHKNVAVATSFGYHLDVLFSLAWTLQRVMKDQGQLHVYLPPERHWNIEGVVKEQGLYQGAIKSHKELIKDLYNNQGDGGIDMVILGTCEIDLRDEWKKEILKAWDARDTAHKFQVVCMIHNAADTYWAKGVLPELARRGAIRMLSISHHVANAFRSMYKRLASDPDPNIYTVGYEHIPVDVHVHILNISNLPELTPNRTLSNAVIQGFLDSHRRDYVRIIQRLLEFIQEDPKIWGYLPLGSRRSFLPDKSLSTPPFRLHLAGGGNGVVVPPELESVIVFHRQLDYDQYYQLIGQMDICIPAFNQEDDRYFTNQSSSTVGMCAEVNTPLLVTQRIRQTYGYIDDDRVVVTRPSAMREIEAIKALRTGDASTFLSSDPARIGKPIGSHPHIRAAVEKMMREGWIRPREGFEEVKKELWRKNDVLMERLLRDM